MFQYKLFLSLIASVLYFDLCIPVVLGAVHHIVHMKSLETATTCSPSNKVTARGLRISHSYGPCSPFTPENSSRIRSQILIGDKSRVRSINSLTSNKNPAKNQGRLDELPVVNRHIGGGNFVVTVGLGIPKRDFPLIFDTGSGDTWVKCKPCAGKKCDSKENPVYNPLSSSTFKNGTTTCNSSCPFSASYEDNSFSKGYYVRDTLTLTPSDVFPNFLFACSQENSDNTFGQAAGLLGVGQNHPHSLIPQTQQKFGKIFCYCLPANVDSTGYLLLGDEAVETCQANQFTSLLVSQSQTDSSMYIVHLMGITIDNQRLNISSTVVKSITMLDSGTVITRLPPTVYSQLSSAFEATMSQYPRAKNVEKFKTCYNLKNYKNPKIPSMVMHYAGLDVNLDPSSVIWSENDSQSCLAFVANEHEDNPIIIGNHQQLNLNVFYNIPERKVSFATGGCGK